MTGWKKIEIYSDRTLRVCEVLLVLFLTTVLLGFIVYQVGWILAQSSQERIKSTITMLNENWKVALLLLVPLFYRTVRMFLERVRKFLGMEARDPEQEITEPNPQRPAQATAEEDD
jgi:hypothetical protein